MQIGVHPVSRPALVGLSSVVRSVPIAARVEPKRAQGVAQCWRGLSGRERLVVSPPDGLKEGMRVAAEETTR